MRSLRTDQLTLYPSSGTASGPPVALFTEAREPGELTTQDIFQVSPDGAYLAYAAYSELHLRAADGSERTFDGYGGLMRFSPDARYLAVESAGHIVLVDLPDGTTRELVTVPALRAFEWLRDGLVVATYDALIEVPLTGPPVTLLDHASIERFVAAGTGTRVVAFLAEPNARRIVALDHGARRELGVVHDPITNAAATLDGTRVAFSTSQALFTIDGDAAPQAIAPESYIHSLWFARDGRLGYASTWNATIGTEKFSGATNMLRFDPLSSSVLVATGETLGLDRFAGGYVVWNVR